MTHAKRRIVLALATAGACLGIAGFVHRNVTDSLPVRFTIAVPWGAIHRGDLIEFCPPPAIAREAVERGYEKHGPCPGGSLPFLKIVAAVPGDDVRIDARGVAVNTRVLPRSVALERDPSGRPLNPQPHGEQRLPAASLWVYGMNESLDSRYFGPIATSSVRRKVIGYVASAPLEDLR
jgi:conjugative transfer signal peptidase TraF